MLQGIRDVLKSESDQLRKRLRRLLAVVFVLGSVVALGVIPVVLYEYNYADKIFSGVQVDGVPLGGLTKTEAAEKLNHLTDAMRERGIDFYFGQRHFLLHTTVISPSDPDLSYELIGIDVDTIVNNAFKVGRGMTIPQNLLAQSRALLRGVAVPLDVSFRESDIVALLQENFHDLEMPANNAGLIFTDQGYSITPEKSGDAFDYAAAVTALRENFSLISIPGIPLSRHIDIPEITKVDIERNAELIDAAIVISSFTLTYSEPYKDKRWEIAVQEFRNWLTFKKDTEGTLALTLGDGFDVKLREIADAIAVAPQDAKFVLEGGKVTDFKPSQNGVELDIEGTRDLVLSGLFNPDITNEFEIIIKETPPRIATDEVNDLGIKEILAVGESDFTGSSELRIKNIRRASETLNGILIKPGEEFSLVQALGEIDAANGYYPEWVIKGDRTVKEYGGGLCQIGTTMFRGALRAGVPVTERRNHSYAVSYYKPYGTDATIYGPHPDLRFVNDTGHYILIQTRIDPPKLYYEFWGTSDGRTADITEPIISNIQPPPPRKLIEVDTLPPGEIKCVEHSRNGLDAFFDRIVYSAEGTVKIDERYTSHYRSWPEICEIGKDPNADQAVPDGDTPPVDASEETLSEG